MNSESNAASPAVSLEEPKKEGKTMTVENAGIKEAVSNDHSKGDPNCQSGSSPPPEQNRADAATACS
jgi:hypothetical protein